MEDPMSSGSATITEELQDPDAKGRLYIEGKSELELQGVNIAPAQPAP